MAEQKVIFHDNTVYVELVPDALEIDPLPAVTPHPWRNHTIVRHVNGYATYAIVTYIDRPPKRFVVVKGEEFDPHDELDCTGTPDAYP